MRRHVTVLSLLLALAAPLAPAAPAAAAVPDAPAGASKPVSWSPCPEDASAECGTITVPVDWNNPGGQTFALALARRKATDPAARIGSVVINPGGPGGSGVDAVVHDWLSLTPEVRRRFDVVGFDPRGVGRSSPILCSRDLAMRGVDPLQVRSQADFDALLAANERYRQDCRSRTGPVFDHVDTGSVVRDLDTLRAALGDEKLTYYGISYGTLIGQLYAERFPQRVRALALDSNMDHSLGTRAFVETEAWTSQDSFDEFVAWCERTTTCALHGKDVRALWAGLLARAERGELSLPGNPEIKVPPLYVIQRATRWLYDPGFKELADLLVELDTGVPSATPLATPFTVPSSATAEDVVNDASQVFCQDFLLPVRDYREYARLMRRSEAIAPDMRISAVGMPLVTRCLGQPAPIPNPQHRLRVDGSGPILMTNALHDPATAYPWAVNAARQIGREARFITYEGWGHGVYGRSECTTAPIDAYLISLTPPAKGTRCAAVPPAEVSQLRTPTFPGPIPGLPGFVRPVTPSFTR